jgi:CRISPR-associated exonuclease Cas4
LGLAGVCDVVEFQKNPQGVTVFGYEGLWQPMPVEYKRGDGGAVDADSLQMCAQAICLEEMTGCAIPVGAIYYGERRRRTTVELTDELRARVADMAREMHEHYERRYTPKVKTGKFCKSCSVENLCMPKLNKSVSVADYLNAKLREEV